MTYLPLFLTASGLSLSEKFSLSGEMLLRGMGTVFLVLAILWGIIALFSVFSGTAEKKPAAEKKPQAPVKKAEPKPEPAPAAADSEFWPSFCAGLHGLVPPSAHPLLTNSAMVTGTWSGGVLTLWVQNEFTKALLNKPAITEPMAKAASARFGQSARVVFSIGKPPAQTHASAPQPVPEEDALDQLLDFGSKFDNIVIE